MSIDRQSAERPPRCESRHMERRTLFYTDYSVCQHPVGHGGKHQMVNRLTGVAVTWTDQEADR